MFVPLQAPLRTSIIASKPVPPTTVTVWLAAVAVKLYQTSSALEEVNEAQVIGAIDWVAFVFVPLTGKQVGSGISVVAPLHSSLVGGGGGREMSTVKAPQVGEGQVSTIK